VVSDDQKGAVTEPICRDAVGAVALTVGTGHACVRLDMGGFTCWGERYYGQLGVASTDKADVPPPGTLTGLPGKVSDIVAGAGHTCALTDNGRVFCFGLNNVGQISEAPAPEHILSPYERPGLAGRVVALGSGPSATHTCAVLKDGGVECWGRNHRGQLGDAPTKAIDQRFSNAAVRVAF
jgi:alpha-tubulin suppressor-like RCC1 family protein